MKKIYVWSIIALGGLGIMKAQKSVELDFKTPLPPESFQFKKRLVNNVSLYTGQPSISIPIYTINLNGMEIPISISYNSGGVKTDEDATFIGLGWSLDIGGEINRTNHGALDENYLMTTPYNFNSGGGSAGIGFLKVPPVITGGGGTGYYAQFCGGAYQQALPYTSFYQNAYNSSDPLGGNESFDARPDEFFYSILGHSGKIMFSQKNSRFVTMPFDDIKTEYVLSSTQFGSYTKKNLDFTFTLPNGYKATFGREGVRAMYKLMTGGRLFDQTWQIENITSPQGNSISYTYEPIEYALCTNLNPIRTRIYNNASGTTDAMTCNEVTNKDNLPKTIIFPDGKIQFNYEDRLDLMPGSKKLKSIVVSNAGGTVIKTIELDQSYFDANYEVFTGNPNATNVNVGNKRLRLNAVKFIYGTSNSPSSNEVYTFDYYLSDKIPSKTTSARDHWGYFNGGAFGTYTSIDNFNPRMKNIHNVYSQTFSLKSIKFPEGGKKEFIYESHKAVPHENIQKYYDDITDDRYAIKNENLFVSGYDLLNFYPQPSGVQINGFPSGHKSFLGSEFEITNADKSMSSNDISLEVYSNLPFQVPNYQNINSEYNYVAFQIQKKSGNDFVLFKDIGRISKSENTSGAINQVLEVNVPNVSSSMTPGIYRLVMVVYQPTINNSNNVSAGHSSSLNIKYRKKVSDEVRIGGLRVKEINTFTNATDIALSYKTKYSYVLDDGLTSSGKVMNAPDYFEYIHRKIPTDFSTQPVTPEMHVLTTKKSTEPMAPLYKTSGSNVGYTKVTKTDVNVLDNTEIKEISYFTFKEPYYSEIPSFTLWRDLEPQNWQRGKLLKTLYYKNNEVVKEDSYDYNGESLESDMDEVDEITTDLVDFAEFNCTNLPTDSKHIDNYYSYPALGPNNLVNNIPFNLYNPTGHISGTRIPYRKIYSGFDQIKSKTTIDYVNGAPALTTTESFFYYNNLYRQLERQNIIYSDNSSTEKSFKYAHEKGNQLMISKNMVGIPLETISTQTIGGITKTLSKTETIYPTSVPTTETGNLVLPISVLSYDLQNPVTGITEVTYDKYDTKGNLLQYTSKAGIPVAIVWGYNNTQPIAKVEGATYDQLVNLGLLSAIVSASDNDASDPANEGTLIAVLDNFRSNTSLSGYQISTYTYNPLTGVTSITPPSGIREVYIYDAANRLEKIVDVNGKVLKEFKYNYKN